MAGSGRQACESRPHVPLTAAGQQALRDFVDGLQRAQGEEYIDAFVDGQGLERGLTAMSDDSVLRRFVAFAEVRPGMRAVECGAGTGRLTFEGGLADAVGPAGWLLAGDPSVPLLRVLAAKRAERAAWHVHVVPARAESVPLAGHSADAVLGARFLHYCDAPAALAEMVRLTRPGGTVAVLASLPPEFGPAWQSVVGPLQAAGRALRSARAERGLHHLTGEVAGLFTAAGLREVTALPVTEHAECPDYETTMRILTQLSWFEGYVTALPTAERDRLVDAAYRGIKAMFAASSPAERSMEYHWEFVRGRV